MDRWAATYIDRAPDFSNSAADVGTTVHSALEYYVRAVYLDRTQAHLDKDSRKELLVSYYQMSYVQTFGSADLDTEEYHDGFDLAMKWFRRTDLDSIYKIESLELKETIKVPYNHPDGSRQEIDFNYIMDRVDQTAETEWEVVDYKSVRAPIRPEDLETKIQARAYALAIQIKHPEATKIKVTFDLLRHMPVSITFVRDDNIKFWRYLCEETQRIVDLDRDDVEPTLNPECGFCIKKFTCELMQKNAAAGGFTGLSVSDQGKLMADLQAQKKAIDYILPKLEESLMKYAAENDTLEWETEDGSTTIEVGMTNGRREFPADRAAEIMGPELFKQMGNMTLGNLEKIIKDESLDLEMRQKLQSLITKGNGNLKVYAKPKVRIIK